MRELRNTNFRLSLVLLVQLLLVIWIWWPQKSETFIQSGLFDGMNWEKLKTISIKDQEEELVLIKTNDQWIVPDQFDYPADKKKLAEIFKKLKGLNSGFIVGQTQNSHKRLEVSNDQFQKKVSFSKDLGFYLGTSPQFKKVHIRRFTQKEVYTTDQLSSYDLPTDSNNWIEKNFVKIDSAKIKSIELQRGKEKFLFIRVKSKEEDKEKEVWKLDNKTVDKSKFDPILRNLSGLRLTKVFGNKEKREYGLKKPNAVITISYEKEGKVLQKTILIGKKKENDYVGHLQGSSFYVAVSSYQLKNLLETVCK